MNQIHPIPEEHLPRCGAKEKTDLNAKGLNPCYSCHQIKPMSEFGNDKRLKSGVRTQCRECAREARKRYYAKPEIKEKRYQNHKVWRLVNADRRNEYSKQWRANNPEKARLTEQKRTEKRKETKPWLKDERREWAREYRKKRYAERPWLYLDDAFSKGINRALKQKKNGRSWESLVPYTAKELIIHIEKQFTKKMTWNNYGSYWHVDHIIPVAAFHFEKPEDLDFQRCWALKNLRPMEAKANQRKSAKLKKPFQPALNLPIGIYPVSDEQQLARCSSCTGCWDNHDTGAYCRYGQDPGKCEGPRNKPVLCPVCLEKGEEVAMIRGLPTGYYFQYRCPRCGNLGLVEREKEQERHGVV